jgi:hypothetical protein
MVTQIRTGKKSRLVQGDILSGVDFIEYAVQKKGVVEIAKIEFPNVVILTQDCDLEQDYRVRWSRSGTSNEDKRLFSVLVAPLYNAEHFYAGDHLSLLQMKMAPINKKKSPGDNLRKNLTPRYHYLDFDSSAPLVPSVVDFKHYFSVNVEQLKREKRAKFVCQLAALHREDLCQRFAAFLSRIGLP